jgi:formylglycine-generating enzyme required for sulfatase activity
MIFVKGSNGSPYLFGEENNRLEINIPDFFISKYPVTQSLWEFIMGSNPSFFKATNRPVECVSYNDIISNNGFFEKLNSNNDMKMMKPSNNLFRFPTETEWEYAARGGEHWKDGFQFSGSNDINEVAWYQLNSGPPELLSMPKNTEKGTRTHDVGLKKPNRLGISDMCGNIWEWCQDYFQSDINMIPRDGSPCLVESNERLLRGGCHHNWAIHCTVYKRYAIGPEFADQCIGFRIAVSA